MVTILYSQFVCIVALVVAYMFVAMWVSHNAHRSLVMKWHYLENNSMVNTATSDMQSVTRTNKEDRVIQNRVQLYMATVSPLVFLLYIVGCFSIVHIMCGNNVLSNFLGNVMSTR